VRLWSLHPQYLDAKGLVALWREGLLAQAVLAGLTRGYRNHPQLERFRDQPDPAASIAVYLHHVVDEATDRGYNFDRSKLPLRTTSALIAVADGQLLFEWRHLQAKLRERDRVRHDRLARISEPAQHPIFIVVPGPIASWERV
jgi:Pyrimidine dimer DNA glycosylase